MADFLLQATLSNLVVATILAIIAWWVQRRVRSASLANLLWALVLIKMVTPPLLSIPVFEVPSVSSLGAGQTEFSSELTPPMNLSAVDSSGNSTISETTRILTSDASERPASVVYVARSVTVVFSLWLVISTILLLVSAFRIIRFHRLLMANARVHYKLSTELSANVAKQLGIRRHPNIVVTTANIAPFVWWKAGRSVIVVSTQAIQKLNDDHLRLVVTHEMAHIKRRDHWFRWLEWIAIFALWWNPVMWWARTQLRISEELACDDLVLEIAATELHQYANSLLNMAELLASPVIRPPVVASAINSGGNLEKRLTMMIAEKTRNVPAALRMAIVATAICVFPLGVVYAQDMDAIQRRLGGAVEAGELSLAQASLMMEALKRSANAERGSRNDMEAKKLRYVEFTRKVEAAIDAGRLSKEDAQKKLIEVRKEMFRSPDKKDARDDSADRDLDAKKLRYVEFTRKIETAVDAGKLSKEDAQKKLIEVRTEMFRSPDKKDPRGGNDSRDLDAKKRRYVEFTRKIETAVDAGKLSKEDAQKKLIEVRTEVFRSPDKKDARDGNDSRDLDAKKRRYMEYAREIEEAVDAGKLSKEDAQKKLIEVRTKMFRSPDKKDPRGGNDSRDLDAKKRRYVEFTRKIETAVDAGKLSKEDAQKKLIEVRTEMFRSPDKKDARDGNDSRDLDAKKRRYMEYAREIEEAVDAGKLSKEDAQKKLIEIRTKMFRSPDKKDPRDDNADREMKFLREIEAAVEAGKLSKEDAEKKLIELRKEILASGD